MYGALQAFAVVLGLALLLAAALPRTLRPRLRAPLIFATLSVSARMIAGQLATPAGEHPGWRAAALLLMLLAFARLGVLVILEWLVVQQLRRDPPRILRDIFEGLLFIAAAL